MSLTLRVHDWEPSDPDDHDKHYVCKACKQTSAASTEICPGFESTTPLIEAMKNITPPPSSSKNRRS